MDSLEDILNLISLKSWPLRAIFKNIQSERELIGTPKSAGIKLDGMADGFKFSDSDKRVLVSISLRLVLVQRMGMSADKFPTVDLKKQAYLEFITLFENLNSLGLYWIIDGVCWLRLLRSPVWNPNTSSPI